MEAPLHIICLDSNMANSFINASYADNYLFNLEWMECKCPLFGNTILCTNVTMTLQTTDNTYVSLDVCLTRGKSPIRIKSSLAPMILRGTTSLLTTMIF
jgi:hypothetical protein